MRNAIRTAALSALLAFILCASCMAEAEWTDFAGQVGLDMDSDTLKQSVTVRTFVDGDTVHFNVPESVDSSGVMRARLNFLSKSFAVSAASTDSSKRSSS